MSKIIVFCLMNSEKEYHRLDSTDSPPKKPPILTPKGLPTGLNVSGHIPATELNPPINRGENTEVILSIDWFQQIDLTSKREEGVKRIGDVFRQIGAMKNTTVGVTISFDAFGITNQLEYYKSYAVTTLHECLKVFCRLNDKQDLESIRRQIAKEEGQKRKTEFTTLRVFRFNFIGWSKIDPKIFMELIQQNILTERIIINLQRTLISEEVLESICGILRNNLGEYMEIELNLSNCPNASHKMMNKLMEGTIKDEETTVDASSSLKLLKLRFVGWGKNINQYFGNPRPEQLRDLINTSRTQIKQLMKTLKTTKIDVILDFREWHADFNLKQLEELNNSEQDNVQSYGLHSKTNKRSKKYNFTFLS